jgi:hypothetical protein
MRKMYAVSAGKLEAKGLHAKTKGRREDNIKTGNSF